MVHTLPTLYSLLTPPKVGSIRVHGGSMENLLTPKVTNQVIDPVNDNTDQDRVMVTDQGESVEETWPIKSCMASIISLTISIWIGVATQSKHIARNCSN
jgi:hypothetical protein